MIKEFSGDIEGDIFGDIFCDEIGLLIGEIRGLKLI